MLKDQLKFIMTIVLVSGLSISFQSLIASWQAPSANPPSQLNISKPINVGVVAQTKNGPLDVLGAFGADSALVTNDLFIGSRLGIGTVSPNIGLKLDVEGKIGATEYCDQNGLNCILAASIQNGNTWASGPTYIGETTGNPQGSWANTLTCVNGQHICSITGKNQDGYGIIDFSVSCCD